MCVRNPNGTGWEGRINYDLSSLRKSKLIFNFHEITMPSIEDIYQLYGVCSALHIDPTKFTMVGKLEPLYIFLYGMPLYELMNTKENDSFLSIETWINEPKEWTSQMVMSMDWDLFCLAYYTFLCSNNDFHSNVWRALSSILKILKSEPMILSSVLLKCGRDSDSISSSDFWETIYDGVQVKIIAWLHENSCYTAYHSLEAVQSLLSSDRYQSLEHECCEYFDEIARERIAAACNNTYTVNELMSFDIETLFFYKDYFSLSASFKETKKHVLNSAFTHLHTKGNKVFAGGNALGADAVYEAALKYAQTDSDRNLISSKRNKISAPVAVAKEAQMQVNHEIERKRAKAERKNKARDLLTMILAVIFIVSVLSTVLFGLLALFGVFRTFSTTTFIVSICVMVPFLIIFAVA